MLNQKRVIIDFVSPQINCGKFPIKRVVNEIVTVDAHVIADGHDVIAACILYKHESENDWSEVRMQPTINDEWKGEFMVDKQGTYHYKVQGWVDYALNWQHGIERKIEASQEVKTELLEGLALLKIIIDKLGRDSSEDLLDTISKFENEDHYDEAKKIATSEELHTIFINHPEKLLANESQTYQVYVDRAKARFSTWYEFFPRSAAEQPGRHGTFKDCERLLPRIKDMGFDVLYFPPIHPVGEVNRKGRNNTTKSIKDDVGSAWGIGSKLGGHKSINPELGTVNDFKALIVKAKEQGIEIALDYALQAAPDHPWVEKHPQWFKWRPDGTVQYAENPPKKYQDILPIYWESEDYENLWQECLDILLYWIDCGIRIFRVDNPHTKPFYFWNWIIESVKKDHPDVLFLAEAFTRPKIMAQLAKQGFTQSYTYFTWRNSKQEFIEYMNELTKTEQKEYMRPNFWPNTPDINPYHLQGANESKFMQRYVLAATLSSNVGIYGPVFEHMINDAIPGKEEYLFSEKFQVNHYEWFKENKLTRIITKINQARQQHQALQQTNNVEFCEIHNDNLLAFYKFNHDKTSEFLIIISLDPYYAQKGSVRLPLSQFGINHGHRVNLVDVITTSSYNWHEEWNYVELHPTLPFHLFKISY